MRKAFTMIELIFVIVIIGILAAVALPKLDATRNDAEISAVVANTKQFIEDLRKYYTANGRPNYITAKTPEVTSVPLYLNPDCRTLASMTQINFVGSTLYLCRGNDAIMKIETTNRALPIQKVILKDNATGTMLSNLLGNNHLFNTFTNGIIGRTYIVGGSNVTP